jgi:hypothetical protein
VARRRSVTQTVTSKKYQASGSRHCGDSKHAHTLSDDNLLTVAFSSDRQAKGKDGSPFRNALLYAAVLMDGPFQREDKEHHERQHLVVKSAIAIVIGAKGIVEFDAI